MIVNRILISEFFFVLFCLTDGSNLLDSPLAWGPTSHDCWFCNCNKSCSKHRVKIKKKTLNATSPQLWLLVIFRGRATSLQNPHGDRPYSEPAVAWSPVKFLAPALIIRQCRCWTQKAVLKRPSKPLRASKRWIVQARWFSVYVLVHTTNKIHRKKIMMHPKILKLIV